MRSFKKLLVFCFCKQQVAKCKLTKRSETYIWKVEIWNITWSFKRKTKLLQYTVNITYLVYSHNNNWILSKNRMKNKIVRKMTHKYKMKNCIATSNGDVHTIEKGVSNGGEKVGREGELFSCSWHPLQISFCIPC